MIYCEKHIALVCNPIEDNWKAKGMTDAIAAHLRLANIRYTIFKTYWPFGWTHITEAWIIGGDGTMNYFINQYPEIKIPLSVFPGGTANDVHWMIYGDLTVEEQVKQLLEGKVINVDAGICNGKLFLNGVGIGFDGAVAKDLMGKKKLAGKTSYVLSALKQIVGYHEKHCALKMPTETIMQKCFMISVMNGKRLGGGFKVAPKASVADNLIDINIVGEVSPLKRVRYIPVIERGEHLDLSFIQYRQVNKIQILSSVPLHAHLDGEYYSAQDFEIEVLPKRFSFIH
jgi:YegS/Rv2252/BmrU family lipid kinase